jgi:ligand-binding sensor domain-containing protein
MRNHCVWIVVCFLFACSVKAQTPFFKEQALSQELKAQSINTVCQTSDGYVWLGTSNGLYRFDGINYFQVARTKNKAFHDVSALFEDQNQTLWIGFENGNLATLSDGEFTLIHLDSIDIKSKITDLTEDADRRIWISTYGEGIVVFSDKQLVINQSKGLNDNYVYDLELDPNGRVWAGTDGGIAICTVEEAYLQIEKITTQNNLPDIIVTQIKKLNSQTMIIGMQDKGICYFDCKEKEIKKYKGLGAWAHGNISAILPINEKVWIGTDQNGLFELNKQNDNLTILKPLTLDQNMSRVSELMLDLEGNIWVVAKHQMVLSSGSKFAFFPGDENHNFSNILAMDVDRKNVLWFSNSIGLFSQQLPFTESVPTQKHLQTAQFAKLNIMSVFCEDPGFVWLGTFGNGLFRFDPKTGNVLHFTEKDGLVNNNVLSIAGHKNEIWLATLGGVSRLNYKGDENTKTAFRFESFTKENGLGNNFIYKVFVDSRGRAWFGTDGNGASVFDGTGFETMPELSGKVIYSVADDGQGNIWFGTADEGVFKFDGTDFQRFGLKQGLRSLDISGIETDDLDKVILVNRFGLDIIDTKDNTLMYFGEASGLPQNEPNLNAYAKDQSGNIWIGEEELLVCYYPSKKHFQYQPLTIINSVSVFLEEQNQQAKPAFSFKQNHFSFSYIGLWFVNPEAVKYQTKLDGHDLDWIQTNNTFVTYSNLAPGEYIFNVRSSIRDNFDQAEIKTHNFKISPPYWNTSWFYFCSGFLILTLLFLYIKFREKRLKKKEKLKKEKLELEFQTLKNQVNPHFLFNSFSTLVSLIESDKNIAVEYVEKLSGFFRNILQYRDLDLISLDQELEIIKTYFFIQKKRFGENFRFDIRVSDYFLQSFIPPLTLQMLVENALKHNIVSRTKPLLIEVYVDGDCLIVKNNVQPKLNKEKSTGVGLKNIRDRYRIIVRKEIKIEQKKDFYFVALPLIKNQNQ